MGEAAMSYPPVGSVVYCGYWSEHYTVVEHHDDGSVSVAWHGDARCANPRPGRITRHRTPLEPDRDRIVAKRPATTVDLGTIELGADAYGWRVVSDCGVVKVYSSRDGCMVALAPDRAPVLGQQFLEAIEAAADMTEVRSYGHVRSSAREDD